MKIIQSILTKNPCYIVGQKITVKGLMLHSVGCSQPSAMVFIKQWNPPANGRQVCVHGFIDGNTGDVYQTLPWNHRGWHGGTLSNNTHIGVEMCEPSTIKYTSGVSFTDLNPVKSREVIMRTYNAAVELFAYLCKQYNLDPLKDGVIISHAEGYKRGIASNHGDPDHLWKSYGLSMDGFRAAVHDRMNPGNTVSSSQKDEIYRVRKSPNDAKSQKGAYRNLNGAKALADANPGYRVYNSAFKAVYPTADMVAREVISGKWGNGTARKTALTNAGYNYTEVQTKVNALLK